MVRRLLSPASISTFNVNQRARASCPGTLCFLLVMGKTRVCFTASRAGC